MATCPHGHANPDSQEFCRRCGTAIVTAMVTCPSGHISPEDQQFCPQCNAPIAAPSEALPTGPTTGPWYRTRWFIAAAAVVALLVISGIAAGLVVTKQNKQGGPSGTAANSAEVKQWWMGVNHYVTDLQNALDDSRRAGNLDNKPDMQAACQQVHDTAEIKLQEHMPSPNPDLTAELRSAIEDSHQAAHMCLAYVDGSMAYDGGQFQSYLDEARIHLEAARAIVDNTLTQA